MGILFLIFWTIKYTWARGHVGHVGHVGTLGTPFSRLGYKTLPIVFISFFFPFCQAFVRKYLFTMNFS